MLVSAAARRRGSHPRKRGPCSAPRRAISFTRMCHSFHTLASTFPQRGSGRTTMRSPAMERGPGRGEDVEQHRPPELRFENRHRVNGVPQSARHEQRLRIRRFAERLRPARARAGGRPRRSDSCSAWSERARERQAITSMPASAEVAGQRVVDGLRPARGERDPSSRRNASAPRYALRGRYRTAMPVRSCAFGEDLEHPLPPEHRRDRHAARARCDPLSCFASRSKRCPESRQLRLHRGEACSP